MGREFLPTPALRHRRSIGVGAIGTCAASLIIGRRRNINVFARKKFELEREHTTKNMTRKWWIILITILIVAAGASGYFIYKTKKSAEVVIDGKTFKVELATTTAQQEKGLSGRDHLDENSGMLFVFPNSDIYTFWMKDTKIPLDIIWINDDKVIEMTTLQPETANNIPQYNPKNQANYVLELNAGTAQQNGFKVGDEVKIDSERK